jgi:hypothetical protein
MNLADESVSGTQKLLPQYTQHPPSGVHREFGKRLRRTQSNEVVCTQSTQGIAAIPTGSGAIPASKIGVEKANNNTVDP